MHVTVIGAGPAGSSAALSALRHGAKVTVYDKSRFPRHKVCGEFLSPEVSALLNELGIWTDCEAERPAVLNRIFLSIGSRTKSWKLSEPARGLSRYAMDRVLLDAAIRNGAEFQRETREPSPGAVLAYGRHSWARAGNRLFGFKAHFRGPVDDVMSLFFFDGAYVGVNAVEGGETNVCGLASEAALGLDGFRIDEFLLHSRALKERLQPLKRNMEWLTTGPLIFGPAESPENCYAAGDCAAFIDPFTGSGMLGAMATGILAGQAAAQGTDPAIYRRKWESILKGQQRSARLLRAAVQSGLRNGYYPSYQGHCCSIRQDRGAFRFETKKPAGARRSAPAGRPAISTLSLKPAGRGQLA